MLQGDAKCAGEVWKAEILTATGMRTDSETLRTVSSMSASTWSPATAQSLTSWYKFSSIASAPAASKRRA